MNKWFGYIYHPSGDIQAKRYFAPIDIQEAQESPFVSFVCGPFDAANRDEALEIVRMRSEGK